MTASSDGLINRLNAIGDKTKKHADKIYLIALFLFIAAEASYLTNNSYLYVSVLFGISSSLLMVLAIYRIVFCHVKDRKLALIALGILLFGFVYSFFARETSLPFSTVAFAIVGAIGVNSDYVLFAGIGGNLVMVASNILITLFCQPSSFEMANQARDFFYLGHNEFYVSKWNNCSSTDFAAHYLWIIAAYLWIRGKKLTWGEILGVGGLGALVYSLTGSDTTLLCICLMLIISIAYKLWPLLFKSSCISKSVKVLKSAVGIGSKFSFAILGMICVLLAATFDISNPVLTKINNVLNMRLSYGLRGIKEYGIHLIAHDVPSYGMNSSVDQYYNFLDCSYISILVNSGLLLFAFFLCSMTVVQLRHKKYLYGSLILAVCALSCVEEHHLSQLPYNMFLLLLFADIDVDKKVSIPKKKPYKAISFASAAFCVAFLIASVLVNCPRFQAVKKLDQLDSKAGFIYSAVQSNMDKMSSDGSWETLTSELDSFDYGHVLTRPDDFEDVTSLNWKSAVNNPKEHSYYCFTYSVTSSEWYLIEDKLITDEVRELVGSGSIIIEYDVSAAKVYSVWYSEEPGVCVIDGGRDDSRAERLRDDNSPVGYYAG